MDMLFAPLELNPFLWWEIVSERLWKERSDQYWQDEYNAWAETMRSKPGLLETYKKYREIMEKIHSVDAPPTKEK